MKYLLRKFFFWDAPAYGAFFGLIALLVWLWQVSMDICCEFIDSRLPELFMTHSYVRIVCFGHFLLLGGDFVGIRVVSLYCFSLKGKGFFQRHRYGFPERI